MIITATIKKTKIRLRRNQMKTTVMIRTAKIRRLRLETMTAVTEMMTKIMIKATLLRL